MKTIAVVLITYNGENFILDQIRSIKNQTVKPSSVYIYDDGSTDSTANIISSFLEKYHLLDWQLYISERNQGWCINAINALSNTNEDIVFWCDQDDVWDRNKIETMIDYFDNNECMAVYSSWRYINSKSDLMDIISGRNSGKVLTVNPNKKDDIIPPMLGCSACYSRKIITFLYDIIPCKFNSPDWILNYLALSAGKILYIDKPLFSRRIHDNNVTISINKMRRDWKFNYIKHKKSIDIMKFQLLTIQKIILVMKQVQGNVEFLQKEEKHLESRINFVTNHTKILKYLYWSFIQNDIKDFINITTKDVRYVLRK